MVAAASIGIPGRSLRYLPGTILGSVMVLLAVALGIAAALIAIPPIRSVLIWISAAYNLWLAYRITTAPPLSEPNVAANSYSFGQGTLLGVANPKGWLAFATIFASTRLVDNAPLEAATKFAVMAAMIVIPYVVGSSGRIDLRPYCATSGGPASSMPRSQWR